MKTLFLIRHAKSSWSDVTAADFDRKLNDRGLRDAPVMAERLLKRSGKPDVLVSSPAKRAAKTARIFAKTMKLPKDEIIYIDELYLAAPENFSNVVSWLKNDFDTAAIFSHNPGITDYANSLCPGVFIDNMPTCSIFSVSASVNNWQDFANAEKRFLFFDYPKRIV